MNINTEPRAALAALTIADPAELWTALGFRVEDERVALGGIEIRLGGHGRGITGWTLRHYNGGAALGGLTTVVTSNPAPQAVAHPNGAVAIDHVVVVSPDFDQMVTALAAAGMPLRRIRDAGGGVRQGFRRLGPAILELVEAPAAPATAFWGVVIVVDDLQALREQLAPHVGDMRDAVQPGRHIATLAASAGLSTNVAFMDPELPNVSDEALESRS
jgi:hypothetical protein